MKETEAKYIGPAEIHDGRIVLVEEAGEKIDVKIRGDKGKEFVVRVIKPKQIKSNNLEGMMLYGLLEKDALGQEKENT